MNNKDLVIPNQYKLYSIYPNPFNPIANIRYDIPEYSNVSIEVFNVLGKKVDILYTGMHSPGGFEIKWDGSRFSSGLYLIRMTSNDNIFIEKVMLVK